MSGFKMPTHGIHFSAAVNLRLSKRRLASASVEAKHRGNTFATSTTAQIPLRMSKEHVQKEMPISFQGKYSANRVILDATEIKCQAASSLALQSATFSSYKSGNTFKGLIGIWPDGTVTFVSNLFPGSISDKECVSKSSFLALPFNDGDVVMADKSFKIEEMLEIINVALNNPPFLRKGQFSEEEIKETEKIASLRIHVERRIQRIKRERMKRKRREFNQM
ncbi:uncharacterized protein LOC144123808 [Amblyomma americanum]